MFMWHVFLVLESPPSREPWFVSLDNVIRNQDVGRVLNATGVSFLLIHWGYRVKTSVFTIVYILP